MIGTRRITRRSFLAAAGIAGATAALTACGSSASSTASSVAGSAAASSEAAGGSVELIVFAAASLTETLTAIGEIYSAENPGVTFSFNFDSSGTLKTQIQEGADCDLFISAGQKQMNQLDSTASADVNTEGLDFVDSDSRVDLLENKVVLCVPENGDKGIDSFDSLAEHLKAGDILFCMGNSDVPVGQYTQKILAYYALDEEALAAAGVITYGSNVKEVTTQITEASVDAGVVYCTDAHSAGLTPVDEATKEMCGQVVYPAAVLKAAPHADAAREFLAYLQTDRAATVHPVLTGEDVLRMRNISETVHLDDAILEYIVRLVEATRHNERIQVGSSMRGALALTRCARVWAASDNRGYVVPDDVKTLAVPVLAHRITLTAEATFAGNTPEQMIGQILEDVPAPTLGANA